MEREHGARVAVHRIVACLLCILVLACATLASGESLHRWLHTHASDGDHPGSTAPCAVCLFALAHCDQSPTDPPATCRPPGAVFDLAFVARLPVATERPSDPPSRGPPGPGV